MSPAPGERTSSPADAPASTFTPGEPRRRVVITTSEPRRDAFRSPAPAPEYRPPGSRTRRSGVHYRPPRRRSRLLRTGVVVAVVGAGVAWLLAASGGGGAAVPHVSVRVTAAPTVTPGSSSSVGTVREGTASGTPAGATGAGATGSGSAAVPGLTLPWATSGQSAVDIPAIGYRSQSGTEQAAPVASLTKLMTAYVILHDHPLTPGAAGPHLTVTPADAANFATDTVTDQSNVQVKAGEVLTEFQMLEGLLVHSANDLAYSLARWDAGSVPAFVDKMNATAAALGMTDTHFADASGYDAASVSTAADLLTVASADMQTPVFSQIVDMPSVTLPVAGLVQSYTPLVGTTDVVGVKTGFTNAAGGGDLLALHASTDGHSFLVLAAVTGQEGPAVLDAAAHRALAIARAAAAEVQVATAGTAGEKVARLSAGGHRVDVVTGRAAVVLCLPGQSVRQAVRVHPPRVGAPAGTVVGTVRFQLGTEQVTVPARTTTRLR